MASALLLEKLAAGQPLDYAEWLFLLENQAQIERAALFARARQVREQHYGRDIYLRGLIEISNHCRNDCYYCGIRKSNRALPRYRLTPAQILACCDRGYRLGLRTFVLQGGEDAWYDDEMLCALLRQIKARWPDCALTLSLGEKPYDSYLAYYRAGAERYLLRHETADAAHYAALHPPRLTLAQRQRCLDDLRRIGYQVGSGFMVGSPGQTAACLAQDMCFLQRLQPQMVGIGPFIPHHQTPLANAPAGSAEQTLLLLALLRLALPAALLPATTALGTVRDDGWEQGVLAGANVIMPNLTPAAERRHYQLYDDKNATSAEESAIIAARMAKIGYQVVQSRGDCAVLPAATG